MKNTETNKNTNNQEEEYFPERKSKRLNPKTRVDVKQNTIRALQDGAKYVVQNGQLVMIEPSKQKSKPIRLEPTKAYRTRKGYKVIIWAINPKNVGFPAVGMVQVKDENQNEIWKPWTWNTTGLAKRPYGASMDIIAVWKDN